MSGVPTDRMTGRRMRSVSSYAEWLNRSRGRFDSLRVSVLRPLGVSVIRSELSRAFDDPASPDMTIQLCVSGGRRGRWDVGYGRAAFALRPGQCLISPAGRPILIDATGTIGFLGVAFAWDRVRGSIEEESGRSMPDLGPLHNRVIDDPVVRALTLEISSEIESGAVSGDLFVDSLLTALVARLLRVGEARREARGLRDRELQMLREFVNDRLASPIELADMARLVHRSRFHFARLFRESTGVPPHEFVIRARVDRARDLLRGACGERSVAEVAREVGFCSSSHMTRHFVRLVGVTPSVWARGR